MHGSVTNAAYATGTFGNNTTTSNTDNETVTAVQGPSAISSFDNRKISISENLQHSRTDTSRTPTHVTNSWKCKHYRTYQRYRQHIRNRDMITAGDLIPGQTCDRDC